MESRHFSDGTARACSCGPPPWPKRDASALPKTRNQFIVTKPMVLVSDKPSNNISILQTKLCHREGHEARCVGLETMPLDQHIEGSHGERQPGVEIRPDAMHDLFAMAN